MEFIYGSKCLYNHWIVSSVMVERKKERKKEIHFIMTGGTIDSYYDGSKDTVVPNEHSIIPRYIKGLKLYSKVKFSEICMKDSRHLTRTDLKKVLDKVEKSSCKHIIITHGTYTAPDSARYLKANLKRKDQIVVITASMLPISEFTMSDGGFNLGYSISELNYLQPGVYLCMNGRVFTPDEVMKIINQGRFSSIMGE